jgi:hypothetical protein
LDRPPAAREPLRSPLAGLALALASLSAAALAAEAALRAFPAAIPAGVYGAGRFDPYLRMSVRSSDVFYTRAGVVRKRPNPDGFLDVVHELAKPRGALRVGFFGDSYVEANQVPTETTFFRLLPPLLAPLAVESFGFGLSGWGTLHALRAYEAFAPRYDLDLAVYVFVENDPGDNELGLSRHRHDAAMPYATLHDEAPGYRVHEASVPEPSLTRRIAKEVHRRSLLAQVVRVRGRLLLREGIRLAARPSDREMTSRAPKQAGARPDPNDLPNSWPEAERRDVELLTERLLAAWMGAADSQGRGLAVLYVPRNQRQLRGVIRVEDTWLPWLREVCGRLGLALLDPSDALAARLAAGEAVYDDHWTRAGHEEVARFLAAELPALLGEREARR